MDRALSRWIPDSTLLHQALTHSSYAHEHHDAGLVFNERLEFLGDAVVGLVVAEALFRQHPDWDEGQLTKTRASIVCEATLAEAARRLHVGEQLYLGRGEQRTGGRDKPSLLCDAMEALAGAAYLASGMDVARDLVLTALDFALAHPLEHQSGYDHKTALNEWLRRRGQEPVYRVLSESGPDHAKRFVAAVYVNDIEQARGEGRSKKEAEQEAAGAALRQKSPDPDPK